MNLNVRDVLRRKRAQKQLYSDLEDERRRSVRPSMYGNAGSVNSVVQYNSRNSSINLTTRNTLLERERSKPFLNVRTNGNSPLPKSVDETEEHPLVNGDEKSTTNGAL